MADKCKNCGADTEYIPGTISNRCEACGLDETIEGLRIRPRIEYSTQCPGDERVVSMVEWKDKILVATDKSIYELKDDSLQVIKFMVTENTEG